MVHSAAPPKKIAVMHSHRPLFFNSFNAPDTYADAMKKAGFKLLSTANNHTFDRGYAGLVSTIRYLDEKGIPHTGTWLPDTPRQEAARVLWSAMADDMPFAVLCFKRESLLVRWGMARGMEPVRANPFAGVENWKTN